MSLFQKAPIVVVLPSTKMSSMLKQNLPSVLNVNWSLVLVYSLPSSPPIAGSARDGIGTGNQFRTELGMAFLHSTLLRWQRRVCNHVIKDDWSERHISTSADIIGPNLKYPTTWS